MLFQQRKEEVRHLVVDNAFARNRAFFQSVERRGVVFIRNDDERGIVGGEYFFCFSFVELFFLFHNESSV